MTKEVFFLRFYGQSKARIEECLKKIMNVDKKIKSYKINGETNVTMNAIDPAQCIEADLIFDTGMDRDNFVSNIDARKIYEEYSVTEDVMLKHGKPETTLRMPGDMAFAK